MGRVFADSNVLFPLSVMDLLLALSEDGLHEVIWTDELLDEWERVIVREHKRSPDSAALQPCTILTSNTNDFPSRPLAKRGVRITDPDTYLCEIAAELPDEVVSTLVRLAAEKSRPPKTPYDLADDLEHAGVPRFAALIRPLLPTG